jgi:hypothetical protein
VIGCTSARAHDGKEKEKRQFVWLWVLVMQFVVQAVLMYSCALFTNSTERCDVLRIRKVCVCVCMCVCARARRNERLAAFQVHMAQSNMNACHVVPCQTFNPHTHTHTCIQECKLENACTLSYVCMYTFTYAVCVRRVSEYRACALSGQPS